MKWRVNTSNVQKQNEFKRLFSNNVTFTKIEIKEIDDPDPFLVVRHKVSQLKEDFIIVDDTSLDVENAAFGPNVKHLLQQLQRHIGAKAIFRVLLGYKENAEVKIFAGEVAGHIVEPRGHLEFGFNTMFLPEISQKTLGEEVPDRVNARALAVEKILLGKDFRSYPLMTSWAGKYQDA